MAPLEALSIEPAPETIEKLCPDCGRRFVSVHGFLYEHGNAYSVYHALLQRHDLATVADFAMSFGSWDEEAGGSDRLRVGLRVWPEGDQLKIHVNDPAESSWGTRRRWAGWHRATNSGCPLSRRRCEPPSS